MKRELDELKGMLTAKDGGSRARRDVPRSTRRNTSGMTPEQAQACAGSRSREKHEMFRAAIMDVQFSLFI